MRRFGHDLLGMVFGKTGPRLSRINSVTANQRLPEIRIYETGPSEPVLADSMQVVSFPTRQARTHYRHELRTLTYVTLDAANGGIIRNLNSEGVAVQAVAPLRQQQRVRLRFELRFPRLRIESYGEVSWANRSGQCGIRFVDLPARTRREISQWIFSNLLERIACQAAHRSVFQNPLGSIAHEENSTAETDGLILSAQPRPSIRPETSYARLDELKHLNERRHEDLAELGYERDAQLNWLSQPLSGRTLAWLVDGLIMLAALLLFMLIFLSITHELPAWPLTLGAATAAAVFVAGSYWAVFELFGGARLGARLARAAASLEEEEGSEAGRFR